MQKLVSSKRITEMTIRELDEKIQMEVYLREKKTAILDDRKADAYPQRTTLNGA